MSEFIKVLNKSQLPPGKAATVHVNGKAVALFNVDGQFYALSNACPHRGGRLGEGDLAGKEITCPWHGWSFDVTTGAATHTPAQAPCHAVKVEGEDILVAVPLSQNA